jgi:acyl dehydratase
MNGDRIEVGRELPDWTLAEVDAEKMKVLALLLADPNPLHFDPDVARRLGIAERPVNQGPSSMAMLANLVRSAFPRGRLTRLHVQLRGSVVAGSRCGRTDGSSRPTPSRRGRGSGARSLSMPRDVRS